jgi:hypothetical protein
MTLRVQSLVPSRSSTLGEHLRRVGELASDVLRFLLGIAVVVNSLVSAHGRAVRPISPAGGEDPLALDH